MDFFIKARGLTKNYGEFEAVGGLDFEVLRGSVFGLVGPNGAGKTTTLRMICAILDPTQGCVRVDGLDTVEDKIEVKKRVGYLPEEDFLYGNMRVAEHLKYMGELYGVENIEAKVNEVLDEVHLDFKRNDLVETLSKGQRRRLAFAKALLHDPSLLVLDEVTAGLDPVYSKRMVELLQQQHQRGKTIILSTHLLDEATRLCDEILVINEGRCVGLGSLDEIQRQTQTQNLSDAFFKLVGEKPMPD